MKTISYVVEYGDWLAKIAERHGSTVSAIWTHPENAEHRAKRRSPDILCPGDVLRIDVADAPSAGSWPYPPAPPSEPPGEPTWKCPDATCTCEEPEEQPLEPLAHTVFLHDDASRRMPGARCRIKVRGVVLAEATQADGSGAVAVDLPPGARTMLVEWAPFDTPLDPRLPYRRLVHLMLEGPLEEGVRRRLEHIGVSRDASLEVQIREFQEAYRLPVDGLVASVAAPLAAYHDTAMLPPLPSSPAPGPVPPLPPDVRPPSQSAVSAVSDRDGACHFSFTMIDATNAPVANERFVLDVGEGRELVAATDGDGTLEYGDVPAGDYLLRIRGVAMHVPAMGKDERLRPLVVRADG